MQLPGFSDEPVRVTLEVTWWPTDDTLQISERVWVKSMEDQRWTLEAMTVHPTMERYEVPAFLRERITSATLFLLEFAETDSIIKPRPAG